MTDLDREAVNNFVQGSRAMVPAVREVLATLRHRAARRAVMKSGPALDDLVQFLESVIVHAEASETIGRELLTRMDPAGEDAGD